MEVVDVVEGWRRALGTMSSDERHLGSPFSIGFSLQL